jgi:hypothetical protein
MQSVDPQRTNPRIAGCLLACAAWLVLAPPAVAGELTGPTVISTDAQTGITSGTVYTHLLDFVADGSAATINGVPFVSAGLNGPNWSSTNLPGTINEVDFAAGGAGTGAAAGSGLHKLLTDFYYNGVQNPAGLAETLTLTGLTPGVPHRLRMFYRQWDANEANQRFTDISFEEGGGSGFIRLNQDESEAARMLVYDYTPGPAGTLSISFLEGGNTPPASWHQYGISNEVVPEPASLGLLGLGGLGLLARRRR